MGPPHTPPGHLKKQGVGSPDDMFADDGDGDDKDHGPPFTPPGHAKDKTKGKKHGGN
jgi:hypothetical protein